MSRTRRHALPILLVGPILLACGLLGAPGRVGADDEEAPEAEGIEWVDGWSTGRAMAEKDGKLLFVYFGRHTPT